MSFTPFDPNMVRDVFWTSSLDKMFEALKEQNDPDAVEMAAWNYYLVRISDDVMMVIKLPENAEDMSEEEQTAYMNQVTEQRINSLDNHV